MIQVALPPAAQAAPARQPDVVVTAPHQSDARTLQRQAEAITPAVDGGYARMTAPVCPEAKGFPAPIAAAIERAIRDDAAGAGIAVAKLGCTPNLALVMVADGAAVVREALAKKPWLFEGTSTTEQAALAKVQGPARAWSTVAERGAWDDPLQPGANEGPPVLRPGFQSRVRATIRHDIAGTTVLIDTAAADGKTVGQLAGYAAMRGLARAVPPASPGADTILALFEAGAPPAGLTAFDRSYLQALYSGPANYEYHEKLSGMAATMAKGNAGAKRGASAAAPR